jgi:hypothetical protein
MHETIKFYVTVRFALSEKIALKTPKVLIKMAFFVDFVLFFRTIDGLLRYDTVRCGTIRYGTLENSDQNGLPIIHLYEKLI